MFNETPKSKWMTKLFSIYENELENILSEREIKVLKKRYLYKNSRRETNEFYGVTIERIRQIENKAEKKIDENAKDFSLMYEF